MMKTIQKIVFATLLATAVAGASVIPAKAVNNSENGGKWVTVFNEDFSKMTLGTEDKPDTEMHPQEYFTEYSMVLPDSLFDEKGWQGMGVYQAGGNCALAYPRMGGVLNSRLMNLQGRLRISVRYKVIGSTDRQVFSLNVLCGGYAAPQQAFYDEMNGQFQYIEEKQGWQEIKWEAVNPYDGNDCFIQFNGMFYGKASYIIDYIKIERDTDFVSTPIGLSATKFVNDGFTASWNAIPEARNYILDLYRTKEIEDTEFETEADIDNITDGNASNLGENWKANLSGDTDGNFTSTESPFKGNRLALLSSNDDYVEFDAKGSRILQVKFAAKRLKKASGSGADMGILFFDGKKQIHDFSIRPGAEWEEADSELFESVIPGSFDRIRIYTDGIKTGDDGINDIFGLGSLYVRTTPRTETVCLHKNIEVEETSYSFSNLDMHDQYSFCVKTVGKNGKSSESSELTPAYGIPTPVGLEAEEKDPRGAYTAKWEAAPKATGYIVNSYKVEEIKESQKDAPIFTETFDRIKDGTIEEPVMLENYSLTGLDDYTDNPGWKGTYTIMTEGMLGCGADFYGEQFELHSPLFNAVNNGGKFKVSVDFFDAYEGDKFVVQDNNGSYFSFEISTPGMQHAEFNFTGGTALTSLMFYSVYCHPWVIDKVTVSQDLNAGDNNLTLLSQETVEDANTSLRINGLEPEDGYKFGFSVSSLFILYGRHHVSGESEVKVVDINDVGIEDLLYDSADNQKEWFTIDGLRISEPNENGIYIVRHNGIAKKVIVRK